MTIFHVAFGGAIGAVLRYLVGLGVGFPFGTLLVNLVGSFLIGLASVMLIHKGLDRWMPFLMVGVLGGFTTFSAFSLDALRLFEMGRVGAAGGYVIASVILSLVAVVCGVFVARGFAS